MYVYFKLTFISGSSFPANFTTSLPSEYATFSAPPLPMKLAMLTWLPATEVACHRKWELCSILSVSLRSKQGEET